MNSSDAGSREISVRLFAAARERAGREVVSVPLAAGGTIGALRKTIATEVPGLGPLAGHLLFAIGTEYVSDATIVTASEVVAFPPVSGG